MARKHGNDNLLQNHHNWIRIETLSSGQGEGASLDKALCDWSSFHVRPLDHKENWASLSLPN
jgi:hypothetical protein